MTRSRNENNKMKNNKNDGDDHQHGYNLRSGKKIRAAKRRQRLQTLNQRIITLKKENRSLELSIESRARELAQLRDMFLQQQTGIETYYCFFKLTCL